LTVSAREKRIAPAIVLALAAAIAWGAFASGAQASITAAAPQPLVTGLTGVKLTSFDVARDGTGGLAYTATSAGVTHAYFSRLLNGVFAAPVQLDSGGLSGASQPVVTADNGGQLLVAFISGGNLYAEEALNTSSGLSSPQLLASNASNPTISINLYGVGYVAYATADGSGSDVDVQYWNGSAWAAASPEAMNQTPGDSAGTGTDAPSITAASDGVGIVAWGEGGHVFSRRVEGTQTSVEIEQDDVAVYAGLGEQSATDPQIASGGDSTYPDIVFTENFQTASGTESRAMLTRLVAETVRTAVAVDGLSSSAQNGILPEVAMGELGRGLITAVTGNVAGPAVPTPAPATSTATATTPTSTTTPSTTTPSTTTPSTTTTSTGTTTTATATTPTATTATATTATATTPAAVPSPTPGTNAPYGIATSVLAPNGAEGGPSLSTSGDGVDPDVVPTTLGSTVSALSWIQDSGEFSQVDMSYLPDGVTLTPPVALSTALTGVIQSADGLLFAGDSRGDVAAVWVQGSLSALSIETDQIYTPEARPGLNPATIDASTSQPTLKWNPATEFWGPVNYLVTLNGVQIAQTTATSQQVPTGLTDGTYSWNLDATNQVGNQVSSANGKVVVDTYAPRLRLRLTGSPVVRATQHLTLVPSDPANPAEAGASASGVKSVSVNWGDASAATTSTTLKSVAHTFTKAGVYRLVVTVTDKVGNATQLARLIRVLP
jgi:PKD repeat protein